MKNALLALSLFSILISHAQEVHEQTISSKISDVRVFMTAGEVTRPVNLTLKKGRNKLVFDKVSSTADPTSVQFKLDGDNEIVSVSTEMDWMGGTNSTPRQRQLNDSLEVVDAQIARLSGRQYGLNQEKELLAKNRSVKGSNLNLTVDELRAMADFYRQRHEDIDLKLFEVETALRKMRVTRTDMQNQLNELNYRHNARSNKVVIVLDSKDGGTRQGTLSYVVRNCGWAAYYDLVAKDIKQPIELRYKAKVFNNTGNDWDKVKLTLSTADPNLSATAPEMKPWYLNYTSFSGSKYEYKAKNQSYLVPQRQQIQTQYSDNIDMVQSGEGWIGNGYVGNLDGRFQNTSPAVSFQTIEVSELSAEFPIVENYTIPSDSKPYIVKIREHNVEATFSHLAVPKLERDAFLLANIVGWQDLNLVPGVTNVYFADSYVGQSFINTRNVDDTLGLSFGRDNKILVTRSKKEEFSEKKEVGNNRKDTYTYEIVVRNNRGVATDVDILDQIPVSQLSEITVMDVNVDGGRLDPVTGEVVWELKLQPGEVKRLELSFTIKYPKERRVEVQKFRTISCPSF